jgi:predicted RNase H-like nuclease (RuvC/YqgF family)
MSEKCPYKDENDSCIASAVVADYALENKRLKKELEKNKERAAMLEDALDEYGRRAKEAFNKMKIKLQMRDDLINGVYKALTSGKRTAKKDAIENINDFLAWKDAGVL